MGTTFLQGLEVTGFGLLGVFGALIALYVCVILIGKIPVKETESED